VKQSLIWNFKKETMLKIVVLLFETLDVASLLSSQWNCFWICQVSDNFPI